MSWSGRLRSTIANGAAVRTAQSLDGWKTMINKQKINATYAGLAPAIAPRDAERAKEGLRKLGVA